MNLSQNFTLQELVESPTATRQNIKEQFTPSDAVVSNLKKLSINVLEPIHEKLGEVRVSSGYRCKRLNKLIGGAINSQHVEGKAVDFTIKGLTVQQLFDQIISLNIVFDQIILEFDRWIHISYSSKNRIEKLKAIKNSSGKTQYIKV
jgi:hypothetical protein